MKRILFFITALLVFSCQKKDESPENCVIIDDINITLKNCHVAYRYQDNSLIGVSLVLYNSEDDIQDLEPYDDMSFLFFSGSKNLLSFSLKQGDYDIPEDFYSPGIFLKFYSNIKQYEVDDIIASGWIKIKSVSKTFIEIEFWGATESERPIEGSYNGKVSVSNHYE